MSRATLITFTALAAGVVVAGCGSSGAKSTNATIAQQTATTPALSAAGSAATPTAAGTVTATTPATVTTTSSEPGLSGSWSGQYGGSFTGQFSLTWQQSGSSLSGTIMISSFRNQPTPITGTVQAGSIKFGTVGSQAITYTGTVSGNTMSGSYQVATAGGGSWNASKSS